MESNGELFQWTTSKSNCANGLSEIQCYPSQSVMIGLWSGAIMSSIIGFNIPINTMLSLPKQIFLTQGIYLKFLTKCSTLTIFHNSMIAGLDFNINISIST